MGRGTIQVAPEALAHFSACLPTTVSIVGSMQSEPYMTFVLDGAAIVDGTQLRMSISDGPLSRFAVLDEQ